MGIERVAILGRVIDSEEHQFSCKLTHFSFYSRLNRYVSWAVLTIAYSSMNDSKYIGTDVCLNQFGSLFTKYWIYQLLYILIKKSLSCVAGFNIIHTAVQKNQRAWQKDAGCCMHPCDVIRPWCSRINDWYIPTVSCTLKPGSNFSIAYTVCEKSATFQSPQVY